eukprot:TRINITY_DN1098_c0_g1_i3.p1 TRINITY_DN1098_c0_g1~~TRINITY_DN1098_c0_g1_i3.p1  ORF type:complete len:156 (-),score=20.43 TRINITY_DN1098_c0_g1_i3:55-522(-)
MQLTFYVILFPFFPPFNCSFFICNVFQVFSALVLGDHNRFASLIAMIAIFAASQSLLGGVFLFISTRVSHQNMLKYYNRGFYILFLSVVLYGFCGVCTPLAVFFIGDGVSGDDDGTGDGRVVFHAVAASLADVLAAAAAYYARGASLSLQQAQVI